MSIERATEKSQAVLAIPTTPDSEIPDKLPVVRMYVNPLNGKLVVDYEDGQ